MKTQSILLSAGTGSRLKTRTSKPLVDLGGKPLFIHALMVFEKCPAVDSVIVAAHPRHVTLFERLIQRFKLKKVKRIVAGGKTRCDSVNNALAALDGDTDVVLIHDAARPFARVQLIAKAISLMKKESAVVAGVPLKPTIKRVDPSNLYVQETLPRETLWEIQTPQVFKKEILMKAHELMLEKNPTDDAVLVERMGVKVKMVLGDYQNIKITTPEDLSIARLFLSERSKGKGKR